MALDFKLQHKLTQKLVMTPQLRQAIKILQLPRGELDALVYEELAENPVLAVEPGEELVKGPFVAETFQVSVEEKYVVIDV